MRLALSFFHARRGVCISAEREGRSGMTEIFLHGLDIVPGTEAVHREGMAEWMEAQLVKAVGLHQPHLQVPHTKKWKNAAIGFRPMAAQIIKMNIQYYEKRIANTFAKKKE